ncbi:hypothetical protein B0H14DRAFT_2607532 [Mycena olivaceomarginata]|nr:hypothetical protein B0H14DRAFT_2607532 [Mycena olivaceomarginata]
MGTVDSPTKERSDTQMCKRAQVKSKPSKPVQPISNSAKRGKPFWQARRLSLGEEKKHLIAYRARKETALAIISRRKAQYAEEEYLRVVNGMLQEAENTVAGISGIREWYSDSDIPGGRSPVD